MSKICGKCGLDTTNELHIVASNIYFHTDCFKCAECHLSLRKKKYVHADDKFFCLDCYYETHGDTCAGCHLNIMPQADGTVVSIHALDREWHDTCWKCFYHDCPVVFSETNTEALVYDNHPYCEKHFKEWTGRDVVKAGKRDTKKEDLYQLIDNNDYDKLRSTLKTVSKEFVSDAFVYAVQKGNRMSSIICTENGADVNHVAAGTTAAHEAVKGGYTDLVSLLRDSGADFSVANDQGVSAAALLQERTRALLANPDRLEPTDISAEKEDSYVDEYGNQIDKRVSLSLKIEKTHGEDGSKSSRAKETGAIVNKPARREHSISKIVSESFLGQWELQVEQGIVDFRLYRDAVTTVLHGSFSSKTYGPLAQGTVVGAIVNGDLALRFVATAADGKVQSGQAAFHTAAQSIVSGSFSFKKERVPFTGKFKGPLENVDFCLNVFKQQ